MRATLSAAGRAFLRAFVGSVIVLAPGILAAPDLNQSKALGVAALLSSIAAGVRAIQVFVPELSFAGLLPERYRLFGEYVDNFTRAFLATFLTLFLGVLDAPDLNAARAAIAGLLVGGLAAGVLAVQKTFQSGENPAPNIGVEPLERNP